MAATENSSPEILPWLKGLPSAPEYHPTLAEFQDPIAYILKIEKEASKYGICKIVPPLPSPPKKTTISNLNRSLSARNPSSNPKRLPTFTTRQQQIGFCPRKPRPVQKPVWQSGETYTLQQFEAKAKHFEKTHLKKAGKKGFSPLEIETLFWKACADKPFSVEYANDMPGSAFSVYSGRKCAETVGETAWNMRGVSRANGSLLKFMKDEIPGVTSPMLYIAMLFSWFAWHVEDHDLHSLNYLHVGASKTWYGVPRDAAVAFEEVVRVHGYGGEVNPLVTFAILGEKTTVMSPEVLIGAGIPCCRLVQNAGEFVVTFPRAYHSGFSHGFNCGEAANIATPEWLRVAKEAAVRRASINYPPMVSHFQLLYALALSLCSRIPMSISTEPRSSRLKDKKRGEGESMIKELFVQNVIQNNDLLHLLLEKGSYCVVLPQNSSDISLGLSSRAQTKVKPRLSLGLCSREEALESSRTFLSDDIIPDRKVHLSHLSGFCSMKGKSASLCQGKSIPYSTCSQYSQHGTADMCTSSSDIQNTNSEREGAFQGDGLLDQGLLSCVTCGILSFACVAIIQPSETAARYLMSADCSFFNDQIVGSGVGTDTYNVADGGAENSDLGPSGVVEEEEKDGLIDIPVQSSDYQVQVAKQKVELISCAISPKGISSLDLLASAYGDSSESEEEAVRPKLSVTANAKGITNHSLAFNQDHQSRSVHGTVSHSICTVSNVSCDVTELPLHRQSHEDGATQMHNLSSSRPVLGSEGSASDVHKLTSCDVKYKYERFSGIDHMSHMKNQVLMDPNSLEGRNRNTATASGTMIPSVGVACCPEVCLKESAGLCRTCTETSGIHPYDVKMDPPEVNSPEFSMLSDRSCYISESAATENFHETAQFSNIDSSRKNSSRSFVQRSDKDSSRMHIFCLEHAVEVEKQLRPLGGVHTFLLCHPDYPKVQEQAESLAEELGISYFWKEIPFRDATFEDKEKIRSAVDDEEVIPANGDWAVKLGINLYYSANLSKSPLYSKQMAYNSVLYKVFGRNTPHNSPVKPKVSGRGFSKQKKIVVAGKWCGKVWMSNQVHPYLVNRETIEQEEVKELCAQDTDRKLNLEAEFDHPEQVLPANKISLLRVTTVAQKYGRKRRKQLEKGGTKKLKCHQQENAFEPEEDSAGSPSQQGRSLRRRFQQHRIPVGSDNDNNLDHSDSNSKDENEGGPSTRLRRRPPKPEEPKVKPVSERQIRKKKAAKTVTSPDVTMRDSEAEYQCDMDGCSMGFGTKQELVLHKRNICSVKGCGKKFFSHKYLVQHRRVHMDDRPLKCPWKGCKMSFKWAWARTEHIRVHTGARPYVCRESGCGQTFRFVSDFSRHKRKTGHSTKKGRG